MDASLSPPLHRERLFDFPLPAEVRGHSPRDGPFTEAGEVASLSADEAVIRIAVPLESGTKLAILLRIPTTRWLERPLEISLSGTVRSSGSDPIGPERARLILVRLDRAYRIRPRTP
jgi:hypothetical protein